METAIALITTRHGRPAFEVLTGEHRGAVFYAYEWHEHATLRRRGETHALVRFCPADQFARTVNVLGGAA